ncbi:glycosyltransferase family 2 protein [Rhodococcus sovatensis]|uniref:Glycosyltransferase family 2 protein n=1 Tax=Rhodococcus sovatensis TaxID=1805840 RepID=A0ABZ2PKJ9_9NOCA
MSDATTVVIVTRDRAEELLTTLTHLVALEPRPPVVVVDNASTDNTAVVVDRMAREYGGLTSIRLDRNGGGASRNVGVAAATTPFVAFSDDDSWWANNALQRAAHVFSEYPRVGLIAARTLVGHDEREDPVNAMMESSPLGRAPGAPGPSVLGFLACGSIVRKSAFDQVGGFSPLIGFAGEEESLAIDLAAHGWELCYVRDIVSHHHPSLSRSSPYQRRVAAMRNRLLTNWIRRPLSRVGSESIRLVRCAVTDPVARAALYGAVKLLPAAVRARQTIPRDIERKLRLLQGALS